jgi:hypothetical protein
LLEAFAAPCFLNQSIAACKSLLVSCRAFLHSTTGAPVCALKPLSISREKDDIDREDATPMRRRNDETDDWRHWVDLIRETNREIFIERAIAELNRTCEMSNTTAQLLMICMEKNEVEQEMSGRK